MSYPLPDGAYVPNPHTDFNLLVSYPGWIVGVVLDVGDSGVEAAFTTDGETFQAGTCRGLAVITGVGQTDRVRDVVARTKAKYEGKYVFIFADMFGHDGKALNSSSLVLGGVAPGVWGGDDLHAVEKSERFQANPPRYVQIRPGGDKGLFEEYKNRS